MHPLARGCVAASHVCPPARRMAAPIALAPPALHAPVCRRPLSRRCGGVCVRAQGDNAQVVQPVAGAKGPNKFSARITQPKSQGASQAMLFATGLKDEDMNKAQARGTGGGQTAMLLGEAAADWAPSHPAGWHQQRLVRGQQLQHAPAGLGGGGERGRPGGGDGTPVPIRRCVAHPRTPHPSP